MASVSHQDDAESEGRCTPEERGGRDPVRTAVLETWSWSSALNVEWLLEAHDDTTRALTRYGELHALARIVDRTDADTTPPVWLTSRRWGAQPYPHRLGDESAEEYPGVLAAMEAALAGARGVERLLAEDDEPGSLEGEADQLRARLTSRQSRETKRVAALQRQLQGAGSPDTARELGQILLARKDGVPRGAASVVLEAFDGSERDIALDPSLDAIANAERFFEEARRRERALERLPREIAGAETRLAAFSDALARLERDGPSDDLWGLAGGRPASKKGRKGKKRRARGAPPDEERLPYTRLKSSGGLEIRVGRGSRDNDALTFRHSAPDDIWLHASQSSGAHVVLRWGRRDENPPHRDLLEAAVAAAVHSRGRHSGAVAVSWTRRKYVRKPRKSPPGTVAPDRVQTLVVEPDEDLVRSLREAAAANLP
jgi:predicted ribosome quality control (RQC) complex YloA/Tae2 family protein